MMSPGVTEEFDTPLRSLGVHTVLLVLVCVVFWRAVTYPFIAGDWGVLNQLQSRGSWEFLRSALSPGDQLFFRPVGRLYLAALYEVFGLNPFGYHVAALFIHVVNCVLVARVCTVLTGRPVPAWTTAMLYGVAVNVHLDPLLWAVGVYELSATFFVLLSLEFFLADRLTASSLALLLALLSKEAAIFVVLLLVVLETRNGNLRGRPAAIVFRLWRHLLVAGLYGLVKLAGISPLMLEASHPYYVSRRAGLLVDNAVLYGRWSLEALAPMKDSGVPEFFARMLLAGGKWSLVAAGMACGIAGIYFVRARGLWGTPGCRSAVAAVAWAGLGIATVLPLPNHRYQYYLTYSLPPLALLCVLAVEGVLARMAVSRRVIVVLLAGWVVAATWSSAAFFAEKDRRGLSAAIEGTSNLVKKAYTVKMVSDGLRHIHRRLPAGTSLVFEGIDVWAFRKDSGPRVWYGDNSIRVFDARFVRCEAGVLVVKGAPESAVELYMGGHADRREVLDDPERVLWFRTVDDGLASVRLSEVRSERCAESSRG
jgi:hypothetical protein